MTNGNQAAAMNGFEMILPFLKPIEHLVLDDSISEVMVNGPDHVFIERAGFLEQVKSVSLGESPRRPKTGMKPKEDSEKGFRPETTTSLML